MKRLAYIGGAVLALAVLLVALAPLFVDAPAARAEIQRRLSQALQGQVEWQALDLAFFPVPHGELKEVRVEIPGRLSAAAEDVKVYLALWPLLEALQPGTPPIRWIHPPQAGNPG